VKRRRLGVSVTSGFGRVEPPFGVVVGEGEESALSSGLATILVASAGFCTCVIVSFVPALYTIGLAGTCLG
jgi:hypothetical protein